MNFGNNFTLEEAINVLIAIVIYIVAFFMMLVWMWVTKNENTIRK